jgi:hypothetical protein
MATRDDAAAKQKESALAAERAKLEEKWKRVLRFEEVISDKPKFLRQTFAIDCLVAISDYFNYEYRGTEGIYYSFELGDPATRDRAHAYMPRENAAKLREALLTAKGALRGIALVTYRVDSQGSSPLLEFVDFRPTKR